MNGFLKYSANLIIILVIGFGLDWFGLGVDQLLVLVDDMDLPLGSLRLRSKGGSGGHNGLKSTINHLNTQNFSRLRIGIGNPSPIPKERKSLSIQHVLGTFNTKESSLVDKVLNEIMIGLELIQQVGIDRAGNHLNSFKADEL